MTEPASHIQAGQVVETPAMVTVLSAGNPVATEKEATRNTDDLSHGTRTLTRVVALFCFLVVVIGGANFIQIKDQGNTAQESRVSITENTDRIKDCTDPAGKCFKEGQVRTGRVIATIGEAQVAAVSCALLGERLSPEATPAQIAERKASISACVKKILTSK